MKPIRRSDRIMRFVRREWVLGLSLSTVLIFTLFGDTFYADMANPFGLFLVFAWLFGVVLASCLSVVRHADHLAEALGQPYGTLILTLSVTAIEVMSISAVMLHGANNPTLVRDTLFSVVMIILGGMGGVSLLVGGLRHREQHYNLQGANTYLGVIIPLAVLNLVLPNYTTTTSGPTLSLMQQIFLVLTSLGLYASFLAIQTGRHRSYFAGEDEVATHEVGRISIPRHAILLVAYMLPIALLAEELARPIDYLIETLSLPAELGGVVIAIIVATPESISAVRSAMSNHLQQAVNIFLGSVLSTIGLTVPVMLAVSYFTGHIVTLGLVGANSVLLLLTLAVSVVTFASGRTNVIQGAVHIVLFGSFVLLMVQG